MILQIFDLHARRSLTAQEVRARGLNGLSFIGTWKLRAALTNTDADTDNEFGAAFQPQFVLALMMFVIIVVLAALMREPILFLYAAAMLAYAASAFPLTFFSWFTRGATVTGSIGVFVADSFRVLVVLLAVFGASFLSLGKIRGAKEALLVMIAATLFMGFDDDWHHLGPTLAVAACVWLGWNHAILRSPSFWQLNVRITGVGVFALGILYLANIGDVQLLLPIVLIAATAFARAAAGPRVAAQYAVGFIAIGLAGWIVLFDEQLALFRALGKLSNESPDRIQSMISIPWVGMALLWLSLFVLLAIGARREARVRVGI